MRRIALVSAVTALVTAAFTGIAVRFGPKPTVPVHSAVLNDPSIALVEPTDRAILLGWWAIAIIMALAIAWILRRNRRTPDHSTRGPLPPWAVVSLGVGALGVMITSIVWGTDILKYTPGISTVGLFVGIAFALFTFQMWTLPKWLAVASSLAIFGLVLSFVLPALLQTPGSIRGQYDFQFVSDEISAVGAGHFPLSDYIPQYSVLLGFPIAPLLHLLAARAIYGVVAWILFLQVVAFTISVTLPTLVGGWRVLAPAMVVSVVPSLSALAYGWSPMTYFAAFPMRAVLPSLTILAAFFALRSRPVLTISQCRRLLLLGVASGITMLNNPDFGAPAFVTVLVVSFIATPTVRAKAISVTAVLFGAGLPFVSYAGAGQLLGRPVRWSEWLVFQKTFGVEGVGSVAMEPFGIHIAFVTLFISASVVGFALMTKYRDSGSRFGYRQGLLLALVGGWSLLSLPYFAGRSYTPTLLSGYSFIAGMVVAAFLPLLRMTLRRLRMGVAHGSLEVAVSLSLGTLAIAGAASTFTLARLPSEYYAATTSVPPGRFEILMQQTAAVNGILNGPSGGDLRRLVDEGRVQQALNMSSLMSFSARIPPGSITTNPVYFDMSRVFTRAQCSLPWAEGIDYLLVENTTAIALEKEPSCVSHFDFAGKRSYTVGDYSFVLLPR
jgi:hypothetical protein